jgi:hypothetical protein
MKLLLFNIICLVYGTLVPAVQNLAGAAQEEMLQLPEKTAAMAGIVLFSL